MAVEAKAREALDLKELRQSFPPSIPVVELEVEDYIDATGEPSLRIYVVLDESVDVEALTGAAVGKLKAAIRDSLRQHDVSEFPYVYLAKRSELEETDEDL